MSAWSLPLKYALDRVLALVLLLLLGPVFLGIGVWIKVHDGGRVFFRQQRVGLNGHRFMIWKFRTMIPNADALLADGRPAAHLNRVTSVGRVLRLTSLDELPQLINIVRGEMSFVGPRPVLPAHLPRYSPAQMGRFKMKPGLTGLAQVNGRNQIPWSQRIAYDLAYIADYSPWLDLKILARTFGVVLRREGISLDRNPEQADDLPQP